MKTRILALLLALLCLAGCGGAGAKSLTETVKASKPELQPLTEESAAALTEFSVKLLQENWDGKNLLLSPLSVLSALGMTANGAKGTTLAQMEEVLGLPVGELNAALASWTRDLPKDKKCRVDLANSLWLRDDGSFEANPDFLQTTAGWYGAEVFPSKFDAAAVGDINGWVEKNTHGMIGRILDEIPAEAAMYLINALALEAEWETVYKGHDILEQRPFYTEDQGEQHADMMRSTENVYLKDGHAQGFWKPYKGGCWAFAALLPDEGMKLEDYIASLTGERLYEILSTAERRKVYARIPMFEGNYGTDLSASLRAMGMTDAFEMGEADFSGMGASDFGTLFISKVLHKTYISVDDKGTKAAAVTAVATSGSAGSDDLDSPPTVFLDRPFLYMLVDTETNLPAFIGAVTTME